MKGYISNQRETSPKVINIALRKGGLAKELGVCDRSNPSSSVPALEVQTLKFATVVHM